MNEVIYKHSSFQGLLSDLNNNGEHYVYLESNPYKFYINDIFNESKYIIIGFTGAVTRSKSTPPYYSFRGISKKLGLSLLSVSDPSLDLASDLGLSWYVGNNVNGDVATIIANFLDQLIEVTGKKLILCGGSGGGFAALNIQSLMKKTNLTSSFVWNPQTDITRYNDYFLFKYLSSCYNYQTRSLIDGKSFLIDQNIKYKVKEDQDIDSMIMINGYDPNHIRKQVRRFICLDQETKYVTYFGDWGNGHIKPPKALIERVLEEFVSGKDARAIYKDLEPSSFKELLLFYINKSKLEKVLDVRATSIKIDESRIIVLKSNIYDYFIGYNIKYFLIRKSQVLYQTNYLLGVDVAEIAFELPVSKDIYDREIIVEVLIEDVLGVQKKYRYNLAKINSNLKKRVFKI